MKRGPWSPEEDKQLREFIEKHGTGGNWISLPQKAGELGTRVSISSIDEMKLRFVILDQV